MPPKPILSALIALAFLTILAGAKACNDQGSVHATEVALHDDERRVERERAAVAAKPSEHATSQLKSAEEMLEGTRRAYDERKSGMTFWFVVTGLLAALMAGAIVLLVRVRARW